MLAYDMCISGCGSSVRYSYLVFFFKQKTAYEMRISDWSSDVCSSDLSNIANNVIKGCRRQGILNSVDYAKITNNTIDGVQNATLGDAILNTGKHVLIDGNSGRNLEGNGIDARGGDYTTIVNND